jgi:RNA polymerase-binding transcription factor DksA
MADICDMADEAIAGTLADAAARAASALNVPGSDDCVTCEEPIPAVRRKALPSARRCAGCQAGAERGFRVGAAG